MLPAQLYSIAIQQKMDITFQSIPLPPPKKKQLLAHAECNKRNHSTMSNRWQVTCRHPNLYTDISSDVTAT